MGKSGHAWLRLSLRIIGVLLLVPGLALVAIGVTDFFSAMSQFPNSEFPRRFWYAIVGLPLTGLGAWMLAAGFLGMIYRYVSREASPAISEAFNDVAEDVRPGVSALASAARGEPSRFCPACGRGVKPDDRFCGGCGGELSA